MCSDHRKTVGSRQWAVGSQEQEQSAASMLLLLFLTAHCPLPTAHCFSHQVNWVNFEIDGAQVAAARCCVGKRDVNYFTQARAAARLDENLDAMLAAKSR